MKRFRAHIHKWLNDLFYVDLLKNKRLEWIDYLRGIAIILVVYHHVRVGIQRSNIDVPDILVQINMVFYSFRMPLFFILSGLFIHKSMQRKTLRQIFWGKFELLLYPYLIWAFLQVTLQIIFGEFTNSSRHVVDYTYILYHPRFLDQFWYLPALFNASIAFLFIKKYLKPAPWLHLLLALCLYLISPFMQKASIISDWMGFYIFFVIGNLSAPYFFREQTQDFLGNRKALLLVLPLFISVQLFYLKYNIGDKTLIQESYVLGTLQRALNQMEFLLVAFIGALSMFFIAFQLALLGKLRFLRILGFHSLYIYVMHVMVVGFVRLMFVYIFHIKDPVILLTVCLISGVVVPMAVYNIYIKNGSFWFLFSYHRPRAKKAGSANLPTAAGVPLMPSAPVVNDLTGKGSGLG